MKKIPFTQAQFIASAFQSDSFPSLADLQEIVLVGKSNVGKSSLINNLLRNKTLAKTSSTPGKTQSINFYTVNDQIALVDLPGYGYAKTSKSVRKKWAPLIEAYLDNRQALRLMLLLVDSRREFNAEDLAMLEWAHARQLPLVLVFTKSDQLNKAEMLRHQKQYAPLNPVYYSTKNPAARLTLIETLNLQLNTYGTHQ